MWAKKAHGQENHCKPARHRGPSEDSMTRVSDVHIPSASNWTPQIDHRPPQIFQSWFNKTIQRLEAGRIPGQWNVHWLHPGTVAVAVFCIIFIRPAPLGGCSALRIAGFLTMPIQKSIDKAHCNCARSKEPVEEDMSKPTSMANTGSAGVLVYKLPLGY